MEKPHRIAQIYGYSVCLASVITFLISLSSLVGALVDLSDPLHAEWGWGRNLESFEAYKVDVLSSLQGREHSSTPVFVPDDQTIRTMYEAAKANRIQLVRFRVARSLTVNTLLLVASIGLFVAHWVWMGKLSREKP